MDCYCLLADQQTEVNFLCFYCSLLKLTLKLPVTVFVFLSCPSSQIRGVPLWRISSSQLCAVLCSRWSVDAERPAGGHAGQCGNRPSEARADWFLPAPGRQRPAGGQRGAGPVDGHGTVATAVSCPGGLRDVVSGCI